MGKVVRILRRSVLVLVTLAAARHGGRCDAGHDALASSAYSIPTARLPEARRRLPATPAGNGRQVHDLVRGVRGAEQGGRRRPARRRRQLLDLDRHGPARRRRSSSTRPGTANQYHGIVSKSVVVFVLRNGNPKHIKTWDDLVKPGVDVVFPNPFSSGGARWDVMAAYGAQLRENKTPKQAQRVPEDALPAQRLAGHERPQRAQHVPRRARATCCSTTRATRSSRSRRASPSST